MLLSDTFVEKYKTINPFPPNGLGHFVYLRTYCRWLPDVQRREYWHETVRRVVEESYTLYSGHRTEEQLRRDAEELYDSIFNFKVFPSGRSLWVAGTKSSKLYPESNYNCSFTIIDSLDAYCDLFFLLMLGTGVGFRVLPNDVAKLPQIQPNIHIRHKDYTPKLKSERLQETEVSTILRGAGPNESYSLIEIGDSKEGWVEALRSIFNLITTDIGGKIIIDINYNSVRPSGERLKTFGGRASGHEALKTIISKIIKIVTNAENGILSTVDALDIANIIAEGVVCGGTRRSAELALGDPNDTKFIRAKEKFYENPDTLHRSLSNNSLFFTERPSLAHLKEIMRSIKINGEPGFLNAEAAARRRPWFDGINPCITEDMLIETDQGPKTVKSLINLDTTIIVDDKKHLTKGFFYTGKKDVYELQLKNGLKVKATNNHKILTIKDNIERWVPLSELTKEDSIRITSSRLNSWDGEGTRDEGWLIGNLIGDGTFSTYNNNTQAYLQYWGKDKDYMRDYALTLIKDTVGARKDLRGTLQADGSLRLGSANLNSLYKRTGLTKKNIDNLLSLSSEFQEGFIAGLTDADGSVQGNLKKGVSIRIAQSNKKLLEILQLSMINLGIKSTLRQVHPAKNTLLPDGKGDEKYYKCRATYELIVSRESMNIFRDRIKIKTPYKIEKLDSFLNTRKTYKDRNTSQVRSISYLGQENVYDITVPDVHRFSANGIIVHNCAEIELANKGLCNLSTINIRAHLTKYLSIDLLELELSIRKAVQACLRMTNVDLYLKEWDKVQKRDRLLGISITGWMDTIDKILKRNDNIFCYDYEPKYMPESELLSLMNHYANDEAIKYAKELRIPAPLLVTCVKPEGSLSQLPTVSSGIHRTWSKYYIRRVRIHAADPLARVMLISGFNVLPESGEWKSGPSNPLDAEQAFRLLSSEEKEKALKEATTWVVEFPVKSDTNKDANSESAIDQLNRYFKFQEYYTDHNTSITLYIGPDEWDEVAEVIHRKWNDYIAISFLPKPNGDRVFALTPYEKINKETYELLMEKVKPLDRNILEATEKAEWEGELLEEECATGACPVR